MFIILSGDAILSVHLPDSSEATVLSLSAGGMFGETLLLGSRPNAIGVRVLADLQVIGITREPISALLELYPQFAMAFDRVVDDRRELIQHVQQLDTVDVDASVNDSPLKPARLNGTRA